MIKQFFFLFTALFCFTHAGIFSTKTTTFMGSTRPNAFPALPAAHIDFKHGNYSVNSVPEWTAFLNSIIPNAEEVQQLVRIITTAESAQRSKMSYWIDDKLMQGQLDLIAINLDNDVVRMISALSKVQIPPVTQTNQVCVKKKLWYGKTKTQCHDEQIPRALTPEEIAFVGKHLETAIRAQANGLIA